MQVLIEAQGIEPSQASQAQLTNFHSCIQQLVRDPRVQYLFGTTGRSTGCAVICEVQTQQEAQEIMGLLQINGLPDVRSSSLVAADTLQLGIRAQIKTAPAAPQEPNDARTIIRQPATAV